MSTFSRLAGALAFLALFTASASAAPFFFSTGDPDGKIATLSQPGSAGKLETETADDFVLTSPTAITHASFTGLLINGATTANINDVVGEIYRVFPKDSANPPSGNVVTRVNSPSDVAFESRDSAASELTFTTTVLNANFSALNSVTSGIHKAPNQTTGGDGPVTGVEVRIDVTFTNPLILPEDHYFFVPQVGINTANGEFLWLSAPKPITGPGTTPFLPDLQSWIRNENLAPDWSRIGTDVVAGGNAFNASFSLSGSVIPLPSGLGLGAVGCAFILVASWARRSLQRRAAVNMA
jgi:hypothetical protein